MHMPRNLPADKILEMKGFLLFRVLHYLDRGCMTGQQVAQRIKTASNKKPSSGTIYPALKKLRQKGLLMSRKEGKTVCYKLTPKGQAVLRGARRFFKENFSELTG